MSFLQAKHRFLQKTCYPAVRRPEDNTLVMVRDSVFVACEEDSDGPYVAKVTSLWEADNGEMMMGVLWYYR